MLVSKIDCSAPGQERFRALVRRELIEASTIQEAERIVQRLYPHCKVTPGTRSFAG